MFELSSKSFDLLIPLLEWVAQPVLPRAASEGMTPARVFADGLDSPSMGLVWLPCGYLYLLGNPARVPLGRLRELLDRVLVPAWRSAGESGVVLAPLSTGWAGVLAEMSSGKPVFNIFRRAFDFHPERFAQMRACLGTLPEGFTLVRADAGLASQLGAQRTWPSITTFLDRGLGYAVMKGSELAACCWSVFGCSTGLEIDIHTAEPYRRRGLAAHAAAAFIADCLGRGLHPNWECFWDNAPSTGLAQKLGYTPREDYPVVYWEL